MAAHSLSDRVLQALVQIHHTPPRIIAAPPSSQASSGYGKGKRASVAIILRIRPSSSPVTSASSNEPQSGTHAEPRNSPTLENFQDSSLLRSRMASSASSTDIRATPSSPSLNRLHDFFALPWVQSGMPEILYIKRASRLNDRWSDQVAFPGGRQEADDENSLYTAMRETWEEVGIDLAEKNDFLEIGPLDDREITTSLGKRLLMVLSPYVFLHTSPDPLVPDIQASEVASAHWVPLTCLLAPHIRWGNVCIDITSRITPRSRAIRKVLALLTGNMHFKCILLPNDPITSPEGSSPRLDPVGIVSERPPLSLWGLTLGMSLDLLSHMSLPESSEIKETINADRMHGSDGYDFGVPPTLHGHFPPLVAPSMTSIFPTFSYPDVNFFIWVFGFRYRYLMERWNERLLKPPSFLQRRPSAPGALGGLGSSSHGGRVNFAGMALNHFYAAVRKALILAIVLRASLLLGGTSGAVWWLVRRLKQRKERLLYR
ncbi:MAG: hypothetical protein CYPHOPRED_001800 [Cyphobasidiales sp. Tagirdzhanova-0007]|nr:MAG: hypothetical protein CYPHOPRED_001800 [Cyphobasidiales sp. Tagirdzhanova-0007]